MLTPVVFPPKFRAQNDPTMADASPTDAAAAAAPAASSPPKIDKTKEGAKVKAKAMAVTDASECKRRLGAKWQEYVPGIVISVDKRPAGPGKTKKQTYITAKYTFPFGYEKVKEIHTSNVKAAPEGDAVYAFVSSWESNEPPPLPGPVVVDVGATTPAAAGTTTTAATATAANASMSTPTPTLRAGAAWGIAAGGGGTHVNATPAGSTGTRTPPTPPVGTGPPKADRSGTHRGPLPNTEVVVETPDGKKWYKCPQGLEIAREKSSTQWYWKNKFNEKVYPGSANSRNMSKLDMWMMTVGDDTLKNILNLTNVQLDKKGKSKLTMGELIKFFGITHLMTRYKFANRRDLWKSEGPTRFEPGANFGKLTGMIRDRYDDIFSNLRFSNQPDEKPAGMSEADYRWMLIDDHVELYNVHRANGYSPSGSLTGDESVSRWYGLGGDWIDIGLPMYVALDRKPENGMEIQNICDAESGIVMQLKLVKGAEYNDTSNGLNHGTNVLIDLLRPWINTQRIDVVADSYFASVATTDELDKLGFDFTGPVKTATKNYPMDYLKNVVLPGRGGHHAICCYNDDGTVDKIAVVWCDRDRRYFISKSGSLADGTTIERTRWRQYNEGDETLQRVHPDLRVGNAARAETQTKQPKVAEKYYDGAAAIDRHNRGRQDNLEIERKTHTKDWATRCNLSVLAMATVDSWKFNEAWQEAWANERNLKQDEYYSQLIAEMIDNDVDTRTRSSPPATAAMAAVRDAFPKLVKTDKRKTKKVRGETQITNNAAQVRCGSKDCTHMCVFICNLCFEKGVYKGFCNKDAWVRKEPCTCDGFDQHIRDAHPTHANMVSNLQNSMNP